MMIMFLCVNILIFLLLTEFFFSVQYDLAREETRNLTSEELRELSELNMFDESNLCHLEVRDPNPPEVIAEKFEFKAQAVLDSISTQTSSIAAKIPAPQQRNVEISNKQKQTLANVSTRPLVATNLKEDQGPSANLPPKVVPSVRPTRTSLKKTVSVQ